MSYKRRMLAALAMSALPALAIGCSSASSTPASQGGATATSSATSLAGQDTNVVVAAVPATGATGLYIAEQRGLFTAAGLHVTIESSVSAADVVPDLLKGSINVSLGQWTSAIAVQQTGVALRAVAPGNSGGPGLEELVTAANSPITSLSQLRGKTIAVNALAGLSQILTESVLSTGGVTPSQVHFTVIPFPNMAEALAKHQVDAAFMVQPYLGQALASHEVTKLADIDQGATADFPITGYVITASWQQKDPAVVAAFLRALDEGQQLAATNRADVNQAIVHYIPITAQTAAKMTLGAFPQSVSQADLQRVASLMQQYGLLPKSADIATLVKAMTQ